MERKAPAQRLFHGAGDGTGTEVERVYTCAAAHEPTKEGLEVTDETSRDQEPVGPDERDDALADWFRPAERPGKRPESAAESPEQGAKPQPGEADEQDEDDAADAEDGTEAQDGANAAGAAGEVDGPDSDKTQAVERPDAKPDARDLTQALPIAASALDSTQMIPKAPASAPTQAIPKPDLDNAREGGMARRDLSSPTLPVERPPSGTPATTELAWGQPQQGGYARQGVYPNAPAAYRHTPYEPPGAVRTQDNYSPPGSRYDDFDEYDYDDPGRPRSVRRRALLVTAALGVVAAGIAGALVLTNTISVPGLKAAKPVPTVGFSPTSSDAGSAATQTGTAFLTDWQNGNLRAAANITDDPAAALAALTSYAAGLKVSGLTLLPGSASSAGWMTFNATAQVGSPAAAWSYSSGLAAYQGSVDGVTRWFVKWQPSVLLAGLTPGEKLALGAIAPTANAVTDRNGTRLTSGNAPSLTNIIASLEKNAPATSGTPGQKVQIEKADGTVVSTVAKVSDPVNTASVKTTLDAALETAAQAAVNRAPNSSMVVIQPSTGDILAIANNPPNGLDTAMLGKYAPGSTFKTITTTLLLNAGKVSDLNQTVPCPATLPADGITLHNSESEVGTGNSFLTDFAASCNNAFSSFHNQVSRDQLASAAHDFYGFNQSWDVGLGAPTVYGNVPNTSSNSLAEELVGQDQITASPLVMASVAAAIDSGVFKSPILVPGTKQFTGTPLSPSTQSSLKTLMHAVVTNGTLAGGVISNTGGVYAKTGTAQVQGKKDNSWTVLFKGDYAFAALAVGGGFGASTAAPEINQVLGTLP
jgi:hypothetical protein